MSVIMDALLTKEAQSKNQGMSDPEGLFFSHNVETASKAGPFLRMVLLIILVLLLLSITVFLGWFGWHLLFERAHAKPIIRPVAQAPLVKNATQLSRDARVLIEAHQLAGGIQAYQNALKLEPDNVDIHNDLGLALLKNNQLALSETHLLRAIALNPKCAPCFNNLGYLQSLRNSSKEAEVSLLQATELDLYYAEPYFNLGVLYEKNGDTGNAVSSYQAFLARFGDQALPIFHETQEHVDKLLREFAPEDT